MLQEKNDWIRIKIFSLIRLNFSLNFRKKCYYWNPNFLITTIRKCSNPYGSDPYSDSFQELDPDLILGKIGSATLVATQPNFFPLAGHKNWSDSPLKMPLLESWQKEEVLIIRAVAINYTVFILAQINKKENWVFIRKSWNRDTLNLSFWWLKRFYVRFFITFLYS